MAAHMPWLLVEKAVCWEIWQEDMTCVVVRIDKPYRLDDQPAVKAVAHLISAAPQLSAAIALAIPIIEEERQVTVDNYTTLQLDHPNRGEVIDPDALTLIEQYDAALAAGRAALAKAQGERA